MSVHTIQAALSAMGGERTPVEFAKALVTQIAGNLDAVPDDEARTALARGLTKAFLTGLDDGELGQLIAQTPIFEAKMDYDELKLLVSHLRQMAECPTVRRGLEALRMSSPLEWFWHSDRISGLDTPYNHRMQKPYIFYPGLRAQMFWDLDQFDWVQRLKEAFPAIQQEVKALFRENSGFQPFTAIENSEFFVKANESLYLTKHRDTGRPLDGDDTPSDWNMYFFYFLSRRQEENCARCPRTTEVLESIPRLDRTSFVSFSALNPNTVIVPHVGPQNGILRVHLAVVAPGKAYIRVGTKIHAWEEGEVMVFDETFEHQVYNGGDHTRVVLFFSVFHPDWTEDEIELIKAYRAKTDANPTAYQQAAERNKAALRDTRWWR